MTPEMLAYGAGSLLSLLLMYAPAGLNEKFAAQPPNVKRGINLALIVLVGGGAFGLSCAGWGASLPAGWVLACTQAGASELITAIVKAAVANQATYLMVQAPRSVRIIAAAAKERSMARAKAAMKPGGDVSPTPDK